MNCIQQHNPGAGFLLSHKRLCVYCEEDATRHVRLSRWCGNVCQRCSKGLLKHDSQATVSEEIYVDAGAPTDATAHS